MLAHTMKLIPLWSSTGAEDSLYDEVVQKLCTYQCKAGGGGRAWGGDLIVFAVPGVGHLNDLVLPGERIFESFLARRRHI